MSVKKKWNWLSLWASISLLVILHLAVFSLRIMTSVENLRVQYTPDDAYYYLTLAKNFTLYHSWTFDSGRTQTSGFHPFLAYILALVYSIAKPTSDTFIMYGLGLSAFTTIVTVFVGWLVGLRMKSPYYLACFALIISGQSFAQNTISMMEWPLVLLFATLYTLTFIYASSPLYSSMLLLILGLGGSLARSDFGLFPFCLFVACLIARLLLKQRTSIIGACMGLVGAALGVISVSVHNFVFTGDFLQTSARMKAFWATVHVDTASAALSLIPYALGIDFMPLGLLAMQSGLLMLGAVLIMLKRDGLAIIRSKSRQRGYQHDRVLIALTAAPVCVIGYVAFYMHNGGLQQWYTANLTIPMLVILVGIAASVGTVFPRNTGLKALCSLILFLIIGRNVASIQAVSTASAPWPYQQSMLLAGKYLSNHRFDGNIGSWNAGIIAYYQGGGIVNLDGLVNDAIYPYAVSNDLSAYLSRENIRYIIDFESMLRDREYRLRGGYDDSDLLHRLCPVKLFDTGQYQWKRMTLYQVMPHVTNDNSTIDCR